MIDPTNPDYTNTPFSPQRPCFDYQLSDRTAAPRVTIVTPFYNTGPIFQETAASVLRQSLQQWEWLIVNDGSSEAESLALLQEYRSCDPRIRVIDHPVNRGLSAARNTGFRAARTPYVVQLDSDDLLEPTAVEKWTWCLESYPEFAFVKGYTVNFGAIHRLWERGFHDGSAFLEDNLVTPTSAVRVSIHAAVGGYDEANRGGLEDWDFWLRCANAGYWGGSTPEYLDWYRWRPRHQQRWSNWDNGKRQRVFQAEFRRRYARLWSGEFPRLERPERPLFDFAFPPCPWDNVLCKRTPRLLLLTDEVTTNDELAFSIVRQIQSAGWEASVIGLRTSGLSALAQYTRRTPDVFVLSHFLRERDYPRFFVYFLASRQVDVVLNVGSAFGYLLLPDLRGRFPRVLWMGAVGDFQEAGQKPLFPLALEIGKALCDAFVVRNQEQWDGLIAQGIDPTAIYIGRADGKKGKPEGAESAETTTEFLTFAKEAQRRGMEKPRLLPEKVTSAIATAFAVEFTGRESQLKGELPGVAGLRPILLDPRSTPWRTFFYLALRQLLLPAYRALAERHGKWVLPLISWVKQEWRR
jgi:glycosyltransferase involved in cell wall biosynthesis